MEKEYWSAFHALKVWDVSRSAVAEIIGGERVFQDHAHATVAKSAFCEGVWWAWRLCNGAQCSAPIEGQDAVSVFEFYDNPGMAASIVAAFEPNEAKRAALVDVRKKAFVYGVRQARPLLVVLWAYGMGVNREELTMHDRETWARHVV